MPTPSERTTNKSEASDSQLPTGHAKARGTAAVGLASSRGGETACLRELDHGARVMTGNTGDHPLVLQLLIQTQQAPLADDFQSRLDEPNYRPGNRLLVRRGQTLLGHVHVANHIAWFEDQRIAIVKLEDFTALPEYRDSSYERELLAAAESIAAGEGAVLGIVHADRPEWFARHGWSHFRGQGHTRASARAVLAHLDAQESTRRQRRPTVQVRTWRHFELDHLRQVYDQTAAHLWGSLHRSEAGWQWLIGRKAQDLILLAVQRGKGAAPNSLNGDAHVDPGENWTAGYAVVSGSCIVEMITAPKCSAARVRLLARACREAMDRDHHSISLYTPAADPLHELMVTAGGAWIDDAAGSGPRWIMRLLSPERWVDRCYPLWRQRARAAGVTRPFELGIIAEDASYRFTLTRRSSRLEPTRSLPADQIRCDRATLDSLLVGNLAIPGAIGLGKLRLSRPELITTLMALFPARLFWQSPLELMRL